MNRIVLAAFIGVAGLVAASTLGAQSRDREPTVEELYLRDIEYQVRREQAYSDDRELKMLVLDELEEMIEGGSVDDPDKVQPILEFLGMEGTVRRVKENNRLVNNFPEVRRRAANLLGRLGGEKAKNSLITILIVDNEPMVKAEAAYGLGVVGLNDSNEAVQAILYAMEQEDPTMPDNNLAYAVCLALEKIAEKNNGFERPEDASTAARALVRIAQGNYIRTVRRKAVDTLDVLKRYQ
ncbi:MAG: HEAT repeat domain-containing protein [Spirochaetales bacterium]|nr:HEAT repeat domain-containing protein [Spirochaetales bacterium]